MYNNGKCDSKALRHDGLFIQILLEVVSCRKGRTPQLMPEPCGLSLMGVEPWLMKPA